MDLSLGTGPFPPVDLGWAGAMRGNEGWRGDQGQRDGAAARGGGTGHGKWHHKRRCQRTTRPRWHVGAPADDGVKSNGWWWAPAWLTSSLWPSTDLSRAATAPPDAAAPAVTVGLEHACLRRNEECVAAATGGNDNNKGERLVRGFRAVEVPFILCYAQVLFCDDVASWTCNSSIPLTDLINLSWMNNI